MPFIDVIDDYSNGATGTLTTTAGDTVGYTVTGNVNTISRPGTDQGAQVNADGSETVTVDFDETVHGMTLSVNRSNPGEEYFIVIDGVQIDLNDAIADGTVEFTQAGAATHVITPGGGISGTGSFGDGSLGFLHFQSPVNSVSVIGTGGGSGNWDLFEVGIDSTDFRIVCFAGDTDIQTPSGPVRISNLKTGDAVTTMGGNTRTIVMTNLRHVKPIELMRETRLLPIRIKAGALGNGLPAQDLRVSRQHRIMITSRIAKRICGQADVLMPAVRLVGLPGIDVDRTITPITYHHILLDCHDIVLANGAPAESLFVGPVSVQALEEEPEDIGLDLLFNRNLPDMIPARLFPDPKQCKKIVTAHKKHDRALLEELDSVHQ